MASLEIEYKDKHICRAWINRPEAHNALDFEVIAGLEDLADELDHNTDIRLFILSGSGTDTFIAGGDLKKFHTIQSEEEAFKMSEKVHTLFHRFECLPCYTLAYLNGNAFGGGIELMLSFDFRLAAPGIKLGFTQGRFYLTPGWGGLTRLVETVGRSKALELQGKAAIIPADKAMDLGLINDILDTSDHESEILHWSEDLIRNDRDYIRTLKKSSGLQAEARLQALRAEIEPFSKLWADPEHLRRVEEFSNR
ncbi:enoyl-CoA hydratase/isomerase family protein [Balneola sp. MJW-20]|uniref:enoyl-CoA hydratase/isomerase family protein n=1 Tax=Gracilimonas aurantiaca TaxID=3234185 RepID=UPI003466826E